MRSSDLFDDAGPEPAPVPLVLHQDDHAVVYLRAAQDIVTAPALAAVFDAEIATGSGDLVVDLHDVTFIDAATVGALFHGKILLADTGRQLHLRGARRLVRRVIETCGLGSLLDASRSSSRGG